MKNSTQNTTLPYLFSYVYDRAGGLVSETYPSQRVVTTSYDAAERPVTVASGDELCIGGVQYAAHGPVKSAVYGSTLTDTWTFDPVRLRPLELKTTAEDQSVKLDLKYWYCAGQAPGVPMACSSNNGNVQATGIMATGRPSVGEPGGGGHDLESGVNAGGPVKVQQ